MEAWQQDLPWKSLPMRILGHSSRLPGWDAMRVFLLQALPAFPALLDPLQALVSVLFWY